MKSSITVGGVIFAVVSMLCASGVYAASTVHLKVTETVLVDMNQGMPTPDGRHTIGFKGMGDVVTAIVIDGRVVEVPAGFIRDSLTVSADGNQIAYGVMKEGRKSAVIADGIEGKLYDRLVTQQPVFSQDGKRLAYIAGIGPDGQAAGEFAVVDGVEGKHYERVWPFILFSPDSRHILYIASRNSRPGIPGGNFRIVLDGIEGAEYVGNGYITPQQNLTFSPDSKRLAFTVREGKNSKVVVDSIAGKTYDNVRSVVFSPDGKRVAYLANFSGKHLVIVDGKESDAFDVPERGHDGPIICFSPDSRRVAYRAQHGHKWAMVIDDVEGKAYDYVDAAATFSLDGAHIAYFAKNSDRGFVVVDGTEGKAYYSAGQVAFSPDNKHVAYWARPELNYAKYYLVEDGTESSSVEGSPVAGPLYSPDGKHIAYVTQSRYRVDTIMIDGVACSSQTPLISDPRYTMNMDTFHFLNSKNLRFVGIGGSVRQVSHIW